MNGVIEWVLFCAFSLIAVVTAAGMLITMSMYRAGLALMASFVALAGLFILLDADLLAAIQVMMNVGGMLVMVLFMVMIMMDPGGEMMWGMKRDMHMPGIGAFSMHMPHGKPPAEDTPAAGGEHESHAMSMNQDAHAMEEGQSAPSMNASGNDGDHTMDMSGMDMSDMGMSPRQHYQMMVDMAMSTAQLPWAIMLGAASALLLILLFVKTPWPLAHVGPTQDATTMVGELLLSRYMIGFEGAAFLILAGIAGAVILARRERKEP
jgi:NADH-quinone oxidoreductase subunit J